VNSVILQPLPSPHPCRTFESRRRHECSSELPFSWPQTSRYCWC
jgi:hypothetical protein